MSKPIETPYIDYTKIYICKEDFTINPDKFNMAIFASYDRINVSKDAKCKIRSFDAINYVQKLPCVVLYFEYTSFDLWISYEDFIQYFKEWDPKELDVGAYYAPYIPNIIAHNDIVGVSPMIGPSEDVKKEIDFVSIAKEIVG
jgi:hypothetical protein